MRASATEPPPIRPFAPTRPHRCRWQRPSGRGYCHWWSALLTEMLAVVVAVTEGRDEDHA